MEKPMARDLDEACAIGASESVSVRLTLGERFKREKPPESGLRQRSLLPTDLRTPRDRHAGRSVAKNIESVGRFTSEQPAESADEVRNIVPAVTVPVSELSIPWIGVAAVAAGQDVRHAQEEESRESHRVGDVDPSVLVDIAGNLARHSRGITDVDCRRSQRRTS